MINLGSDQPVVLMDALRQGRRLVGKQAKIDFRPMHRADVPATWADISKAERLLGWRPQVTTAEGIRRLVVGTRQTRPGHAMWRPDKLANQVQRIFPGSSLADVDSQHPSSSVFTLEQGLLSMLAAPTWQGNRAGQRVDASGVG